MDQGDGKLIVLDFPGPTELFRRFRAWVLRREVEVVGQCKMCGNCCRDIVLYHGGRWITNEKQLKELCRDDPGAERMVCTGRDDEGVLTFTCSALTEEGFCSVHEDRMSLCRNYPTKGLYYRGGWLDARCGYSFKVTRFRDVIMHRKRVRMPRFDKILEQEKNKL